MATLSWDGSAPPSGRTETSREVALPVAVAVSDAEAASGTVAGLRVRATAIGAADLRVEVSPAGPGVWLIAVAPLGAVDADPARVRVEWRLPCAGATALWRPDTDARWLPPSWSRPRVASFAQGVPVGCLVGAGDAALVGYAVAERVLPVSIGEGTVEETGDFACWVEQEGELLLRLDLSGRQFSDAVQEMARWWASSHGSAIEVPAGAFEPVFCTWYARHLEITAGEVERLAALAAPLGFTGLIVDDGWQTAETSRSYATTGDWEPAFPDFAAHVAGVQGLGLAYLLWCAPPFAGDRSAAGQRFGKQRLEYREELETSVLDPAVPGVRAHLVARLAVLVEEYGLDGLKVDFVDTFARYGGDAAAIRQLLAELARALPPGLLIEHRQPYVGPGLWPYATMVRATDCPHNAAENRQRTADLRLTAGPLAVHADPLTWHPAESPAGIAALIQNVLFATVQVSVDLGVQREEQLAALRFWLSVSRQYVDLLQKGEFRAHRPDLGYPLLSASLGAQRAYGRYGPVPIAGDGDWSLLLVANADPDPLVHLGFPQPLGPTTLLVQDPTGATLTRTTVRSDTLQVRVPRGGLLTLTR
ncbi:alpha-galactosidase [Streptomyces tateyamensis]|uniref:Alpha-galactosidase n=1 Tax=Streptomyces tateyamensis TaxID=565073 RepID=A0A2V4NDH2_9ACTN|nr:glycoside hydrolase family 36 protein [Streptomyces tateyamensis]PYC77209.1 alpha-galactosidase [Streptomyces tateyamensis]